MRRLVGGIAVAAAPPAGAGILKRSRERSRGQAAVTIRKPRAEVEAAWDLGHAATFTEAPGDRGTEVLVDAQLADELRRFKQRVETGEVQRA